MVAIILAKHLLYFQFQYKEINSEELKTDVQKKAFSLQVH